MSKLEVQLNYNKNSYIEQNKQYKNKGNIIKNKNQLNDNMHYVGKLSTPVSDLLKVFCNTRSDNKILKHNRHALKITKSNSTNINTIKQSTKHKQQTSTSKLHSKKVSQSIQPIMYEYTLFILVIEKRVTKEKPLL